MKKPPRRLLERNAEPQSPISTLPDERLAERRPVFIENTPPGEQLATQPDEPDDDTFVPPEDSEDWDDEEILLTGRKRLQSSAEAESMLRTEMIEDVRFRDGTQWPDQILAERTADKRPVITINRLPTFIKQITNPERQIRPSIQINPVGDGADRETAEVIQGIIRHIEYLSHAEVAYDKAYEDAVTMGRGWFRVLTDYVDESTFDQDIIVRRISNAFTVYVDPAAMEFDYSDARFMFVIDDIPKDEYVQLYGEENAKSLEYFSSDGLSSQQDWFPEGRVRIAEYWWVETREREIALIRSEDGVNTITLPIDQVPEGRKILRRRKVEDRIVKWVKMNGAEVLERHVWPGRWIPIVPVIGDEININGRKDLVGIVRFARDPQRMYNYWVSAQTEMIALAPKAPYIGVEGQFAGHETSWKQANTRNQPYLQYKPVSIGGKAAPAPARQNVEPPIQAITMAIRQADQDLKGVTGIYDPTLGSRGPEESGKAILARQKQGEIANINFIDNLSRSMWHCGRIFLDLIPKIYDAPRVMTILGDDQKRKTVVINDQWIHEGVERLYDVRIGKYAVTLSTVPTNQTRRQEAATAMMELAKSAPQIVPLIMDLMVEEMDWPMAKQVSERLKKALPPPLQDTEEGKAQASLPQLQQENQMLKMQMQELQQLVQGDQIKLEITKMQNDAKMSIERLHAETQIAVAEITKQKDVFLEERERIGLQMEQERDHQHEAEQADLDRQHTAATKGMELQAKSAEAERGRQHEQVAQQIDHAAAAQEQERDHAGKVALTDRQHVQKVGQADQQHRQRLTEGQQGHRQELDREMISHSNTLEQGEQGAKNSQAQAAQGHQHKVAEAERGHKHKVAEIQAKPHPKPANPAKPKGK